MHPEIPYTLGEVMSTRMVMDVKLPTGQVVTIPGVDVPKGTKLNVFATDIAVVPKTELLGYSHYTLAQPLESRPKTASELMPQHPPIGAALMPRLPRQPQTPGFTNPERLHSLYNRPEET